jgi:hypothetical protein
MYYQPKDVGISIAALLYRIYLPYSTPVPGNPNGKFTDAQVFLLFYFD